MTALIDADSLLYKAGFTFEEKTNWNELEQELGIEKETSISITSNIIEAKNSIDGLIENIKFKTGCDDIELWLTGKGNFRYEVLESYKHNRKDSRKPIDYKELWDYLTVKYKAKIAEGYEADDVVVFLKTKYFEDYFLCAIDKDVLYQTVGYHYNYNKDEFIDVKEEETIKFFYHQVLKGDPVDGYKGCPKIGEKKASKILDEADDYWEAVVKTYESKGLTKDDAIIQAQMANMHQLELDKNECFKVKLWTPKN